MSVSTQSANIVFLDFKLSNLFTQEKPTYVQSGEARTARNFAFHVKSIFLYAFDEDVLL